MNALDAEAQRELEILVTIAAGGPVTQRALARRLGVALGLTNLYLKRLAHKGHIKITAIPPGRIKYLVTPRGFAQKARLTYEYMRYSLRLYRQVRQALREIVTSVTDNGTKRIALWGTGETAELAYVTLRELGIEPVAGLDGDAGGRFLGYPVRDAREVTADDFDYLLVATLDSPDGVIRELEARGIPRARLIGLDTRRPGERDGGRPRR